MIGQEPLGDGAQEPEGLRLDGEVGRRLDVRDDVPMPWKVRLRETNDRKSD